jgi:hypothetical protein
MMRTMVPLDSMRYVNGMSVTLNEYENHPACDSVA